MTTRNLAILSLVLWGLTVIGGGWIFVKGWTTKGTDNRTEIKLAPPERDAVLGEMRQVLAAVNGIITGLVQQDMAAVQKAATSAGMAMATDPALMAKLPAGFKGMGLALHNGFDSLADGAAKGENQAQILSRLSSLTSSCVACHQAFRLGVTNASTEGRPLDFKANWFSLRGLNTFKAPVNEKSVVSVVYSLPLVK